MTIQLKITWNNAGSNLISNGNEDSLLIVAQNNAAAPEDKSRRVAGTRIFSLTDDGDVKVTFTLKVDVPGPGIQTVLKVVQRFHFTAGDIDPNSFSYDLDTSVFGIPGVHPLVALPSAQQSKGAAVMVVTTDFVDVTTGWLDALFPSTTADRTAFNSCPHFGTDFRVLACLNGFPKLWFASVAEKAATANQVSALVFFRPAGYTYHQAGDDFGSVFNSAHDFFKIWRFLLRPVCDRAALAPQPAGGTPAASGSPNRHFFDHLDAEGNVAAAVERALHEAGKSLVVLFPVPEGASYDQPNTRSAASASSFELARLAVACLHTREKVMATTTTPFGQLTRFGLAGFSFGGEPMWKTLKEAASKHPRPLNRIQELYAFDANGWRRIKADPTPIVKTAAQNGDVKLRVVAPVRADADLSAFPSRGIDRSAHPNLTLFPDFFDLKKERHGGNPALSRWYFHFVKRVFDTMSDFDWFDKKQPGGGIPDNGSLDRGARHQFAVFGGEDSTTGQTFISRFLQLSGF